MNKSEIRRQIKEDSRKQLEANKKILMLATLIVTLISAVPQFVSELFITSYKIDMIISILTIIIGTPLTLGFMILTLDCTKGRDIKLNDLLKGFDRLYQSYSTSLLQLLIIFILTAPLVAIPIVLSKDSFSAMVIVSSIITISGFFFSIILSQVEYVIADKEDIAPIEAIKKSIIIIKNHIGEYIVLTLSFIGWVILVGITFGIAYIWVGPYMQLSYANFYEYAKEDKLNNYKKIKKHNPLIGLLIGVLLCGYVLFEHKAVEVVLTPKVVKEVLKENNLKLISTNEASSYYISDEEGRAYNIKDDYEGLSMLSKYTVIVKNHPLDSEKGDNIESTVIYMIVEGDKILGISCEPYDSKEKADIYRPIPGNYDIKGNKL
ncbi:MAG: DUF975 family protein [Paraclostridium sp.]|uniref:DUF975 family protein n=1 Tax=Paraclostridium sp. TaxID=2023273 RepID=UPI003F2EBE66